MARLPLRLIPGHPDHAGGLQFVATSLWAFWVPSFALGSVTAGAIANRVVHHGASPFEYSRIAIGRAIFVLVLFAGPLLVFMGQLRDAKRRGMFEYGALAGSVGEAFERKWLKHAGNADAKALEVGDFSATTDLFQVVANTYAMRIAPLSVISLAVLIASALVPLAPVWLTVVPLPDLVGGLSKFLF